MSSALLPSPAASVAAGATASATGASAVIPVAGAAGAGAGVLALTGSPVAAHRKADFSARIQETENLTIYGNVGNVTIDVNGGSSAKDVAASITSRLSETGVSATAHTRLNISFEEEPNGTQTTDTVSFNVYGKKEINNN